MTDTKKPTSHSSQTNVGAGSYQQTYYTDAVSVKADNTPAKTPPLKTNPDATYYFYITAKAYQNIGFLGDELYGPSTPGTKEAFPKFSFMNHNLQVYGIKPIPAGAWLFVPKIGDQYEIGNVLKFMDVLKLSMAEQTQLDETGQSLYGQGVKLLGYMYFTLKQAAEGMATGLSLMDDNFNQVKQAAEDLASLGEQAKQVALAGSEATRNAIKAEIKAKTAELTQKIQTFLEKIGKPSEAEIQKIKADTTLEWQKNLLSLRELNLPETELDGLNAIIVKGSKIASYSSVLGKLLFRLAAAETGFKIYEACKANPESPLCYQAAAEDSGEFIGNTAGSYVVGKAASYALTETTGGTSAAELLGCNMALDLETFGGGALVCTAAIFGASSVGGYYVSKIGDYAGTLLYKESFDLYQKDVNDN